MDTCKRINGSNSKVLTRITVRTIREEVNVGKTFDLVRWVRSRRVQWLEHILRMDEGRLVHRAVKYVYENRREGEGDLFLDAPVNERWDQLLQIVGDREVWKGIVAGVKERPFHRLQSLVRECDILKGIRPELLRC